MKYLMNVNSLASLVFAGLLNSGYAAQEPDMQAIEALESFISAWNSADNSALRETINYPHITHGPQGLIIANQASEFTTDFDQLRQQGWARSSFDEFTVRQTSEDKVNIEVAYSRYNDTGEVYSRGYVFYIVTRQNGHWGMQYRSPGALPGIVSPAQSTLAEQQARAAVAKFFQAFNDADNQALLTTNHLPQVMINGGNYLFAEDENSPIVTMNFERLKDREGWHHSDMDGLLAVNVTPAKVMFELTFNRFHADGTLYRTVPALWVLTRKGDKWGVEFRSLMVPVLDKR